LAQTFPAFTAPSVTTPVYMDAGVSSAQVPNGLYTTALMSVWSTTNNLTYSISADGLNSVYSSEINTGGYYIDCLASYQTCSASIAVFENKIYISFADSISQGLDVFEAAVVPGAVGYTFQLVYQDNTSPMTTSPAMAVLNNGSVNKLEIVYGVNTSSIKNAYYAVTFNGTSWTPASALGEGIASGAQPGMVQFNNKLWLCLQQNNSSHNLFYSSSSDGITWAAPTEVSSLQLGGGASMVVFNNDLVLATQQNNSNKELWIFSSPNGTTWTGEGYSSLLLGNVPALSLFNSDISLQYQSKNSNQYLESDLASH